MLNMLISNYSGDIIIGRGVTTPSSNYTFGAIVGGNFKSETSTGDLGTHTIRIEAGKYNNIIAGSTLSSATTTTKSVGTFKPSKNANPYIGEKEKIEFVDEEKLEVVCDINIAKRVLNKIREVHPYEEPGIDIIPLINEDDL